MDAILDARNARTAAAARGRAVSVVDPLPFDACGDRRALVINALDDVLEKRFLDTVRAPFRTLVDEGVAPGRFARVPLVDGPPCRELASADLRTCARSTHVCQLPRVDDVENAVAVRHYARRRRYTFNQCERRDTSDAFRGALRRSTIDFMKRAGAATPEASLADVSRRPRCAHVRCLRPSHLAPTCGRRASSRRAGRGGGAPAPGPAASTRWPAPCPRRRSRPRRTRPRSSWRPACSPPWASTPPGSSGRRPCSSAAAAAADAAKGRAGRRPATAGARVVAEYENMRGSGAAAAAAAAHAAAAGVLGRSGTGSRTTCPPCARWTRRRGAGRGARRSAVLADDGGGVGGRDAGGGARAAATWGARRGGPRRGGAPRGELRVVGRGARGVQRCTSTWTGSRSKTSRRGAGAEGAGARPPGDGAGRAS